MRQQDRDQNPRAERDDMTTPTDDVVQRLRDHENEGVTHSDRYALREEAADTIEALTAELSRKDAAIEAVKPLVKKAAQIVDFWNKDMPQKHPLTDLVSAARAALQPKETPK